MMMISLLMELMATPVDPVTWLMIAEERKDSEPPLAPVFNRMEVVLE